MFSRTGSYRKNCKNLLDYDDLTQHFTFRIIGHWSFLATKMIQFVQFNGT